MARKQVDSDVKRGTFVDTYMIVDKIAVPGINPEFPALLEGEVTRAELYEKGCDFEWLLKAEQIYKYGVREVENV